jgi:Tfp pilus assembly protein PilP
MRYLLLAFALTACGGDEPAKPQTPGGAPGSPQAPAPAGAPAAGSGSALPIANKVELLVECTPPREDAEKCDPNALRPVVIGEQKVKVDPKTDKVCDEGQYCLATKIGYLCGACPERDTIRHLFKDRDFAIETNRDPFSNAIMRPAAGSGSGDLPRDLTNRCPRQDQLRVPNYGYMDLKLVGIVRQGTQRKVLMMDPGNYGHIIRAGDCVGKERAWVKDIGDNFVCLEATDPSGTRVLEPHCPELHSKSVTPLPTDIAPPATRTTTPPVTTPPTQTPPTQTPPAPDQPSGRNQPAPQTPPVPPQQPPTNLKP